ncbi:PadR family transcriptional regulator [Streptococcus dentiloxodontae]
MESQLKRGLIEICVLAALRKEDSYGYKIIKDISDYIKISESTLYPILKRLEASGSLEVYTVEHKSRLRKYYHLTDAGKQQIDKFIDEWVTVERAYQFIKGDDSHG